MSATTRDAAARIVERVFRSRLDGSSKHASIPASKISPFHRSVIRWVVIVSVVLYPKPNNREEMDVRLVYTEHVPATDAATVDETSQAWMTNRRPKHLVIEASERWGDLRRPPSLVSVTVLCTPATTLAEMLGTMRFVDGTHHSKLSLAKRWRACGINTVDRERQGLAENAADAVSRVKDLVAGSGRMLVVADDVSWWASELQACDARPVCVTQTMSIAERTRRVNEWTGVMVTDFDVPGTACTQPTIVVNHRVPLGRQNTHYLDHADETRALSAIVSSQRLSTSVANLALDSAMTDHDNATWLGNGVPSVSSWGEPNPKATVVTAKDDVLGR